MPTTHSSIKLILDHTTYDPISGKIYNKSGRLIGYDNGTGYIKVDIKQKSFYGHQIAFAHMKWYIPEEIDHDDKNKSNNTWTNLREASHHQNSSNVLKRSTNKSGVKGVSWAISNYCWRMDIQHKGIKYHSYHDSIEEAHEAYKLKSNALHGEFGSHE